MSEIEEEIIRLRNAYKGETRGNMEEGFFVKGELITFSRTELFQGKLVVNLPEAFTDLPLEYAKMKYPSEQRPSVIKSNKEGSVNFTFKLLSVSVPINKIGQLRNQMKNVIKRFQPANIFFEQGEIKINTIEAAWFDYKSHGIDQKLYNLMYFMPLGEQVLHGVFNCPMDVGKDWKPVVFEVIKSIVWTECRNGEESAGTENSV